MIIRQANDGSIELVIEQAEVERYKEILMSGQFIQLKDLPIAGLDRLFIGGTLADKGGEGNLRSVILPHEGVEVDVRQVKDFVEGLGSLLGFRGSVDIGEYRELTTDQLKDALLGQREFPYRQRINPENFE